MKPEIAALVLAAGSSSRLGQCKQLLQLRGETLIHRVARQALSCCPGSVICVLGAEHAAVAAAVEDLAVQTCLNQDWKSGMASSLRSGIAALPDTVAGVMVLVCDQHRIEAIDLKRLLTAWSADSIVAAFYGSALGVPAIFPRRLFGQLSELQGDQGARNLLRSGTEIPAAVEMPAAGFDLDTPADLPAFR
jgi:molybdenum cofactor cytidylyltransferase